MRIGWALLLLMPLASAGDSFILGRKYEKAGDRMRAAQHYRAALDARPRLAAARRGLSRQKVTAHEALRLTHGKNKRERASGLAGIFSLEREKRLRALIIALRNVHRDVRQSVISALGESYDRRAVRPLIARLRLTLLGGNPQSVYIAQTRQIAYVQDYDVEVA